MVSISTGTLKQISKTTVGTCAKKVCSSVFFAKVYKSNRVIFKKKALEKLVIMCDMFLNRKNEEMHGSLILILYNTC